MAELTTFVQVTAKIGRAYVRVLDAMLGVPQVLAGLFSISTITGYAIGRKVRR